MIKPHYLFAVLFACIFLLVTSCVDDVDFEQGEDFTVRQENTVSLVFFDLDSTDFSQSPNLILRDTTRLSFLDDAFVQDNLVSAAFFFRYTNTFHQSFNNRIGFLSEDNSEKYAIEFQVDGSPDNSEVTMTLLEPIPVNELDSIKQSIKMVVELELIENGQPIDGLLNFQSRADFVLELGGPSTDGL